MTKGKKKQNLQKPDFLLSALAIVILAFGLVMVLSAGAKFSYQYQDNVYYLFLRQLMWAFIGLAAALVAFMIPYNKWRRICGIALIAVGVLLLLVKFTPAGVANEGAVRWLDVFGIIQIQPSELAKPVIVIFLAHNFDRFPVGRLKDAFWPYLLALAIILLILTEDLGSAIVMLATTTAMLAQTALPLRYFIIGLPAAFALGSMYIASRPYQMERINGWLEPWQNVYNAGYHSALSQYALATGGLFGIGIGGGNESTRVLPEKYNDMIFAVIGQELGFFGAMMFLLVLTFFIIRCYYISYCCKDRFGRLLGFGLSSLLAFQCAVNICACIGVLPITGITLPLVSYGGTSLLISMFVVGILLSISRGMSKGQSKRQSIARKNQGVAQKG